MNKQQPKQTVTLGAAIDFPAFEQAYIEAMLSEADAELDRGVKGIPLEEAFQRIRNRERRI